MRIDQDEQDTGILPSIGASIMFSLNAMIIITAPTYRQCSQYSHQYIDHLTVPTRNQCSLFFASGTLFSQGVLLDRSCLHTRRNRTLPCRERETKSPMITFNCLSSQPVPSHPSRILISLHPSQLLPHIQFVPFFSEAMYFSILYLKDSSSCPFRLLSAGLNAIVRLPTVTTFSAVP